jgi:hypothetical protein
MLTAGTIVFQVYQEPENKATFLAPSLSSWVAGCNAVDW